MKIVKIERHSDVGYREEVRDLGRKRRWKCPSTMGKCKTFYVSKK